MELLRYFRYRSLHRSFRRNERPPKPQRRVSGNLDDNLSLTLTRQEDDDMVRTNSSATASTKSRSKSGKKQRSSSGTSRRWPFSRKSSKSIVQQSSTSSNDDDIIQVTSPHPSNSDLDFRMPISPTRSRAATSPRRSVSADSENLFTRSVSMVRDEVTNIVAVPISTSNEQGGSPQAVMTEIVNETQQGASEPVVGESLNVQDVNVLLIRV